MARSFAALACLALARACSWQNCSACGEAAQCNAMEGCRDESPDGKYEARYCRPHCGGNDGLGCRLRLEGRELSDVGVGCLAVTVLFLIQGCKHFVERRQSKASLEQPRAFATVQEKRYDATAREGENTVTKYFLMLQFRKKQVIVSHEVEVFFELWRSVEQGDQLEVAYHESEASETSDPFLPKMSASSWYSELFPQNWLVVVQNEELREAVLALPELLCLYGLLFTFLATAGVSVASGTFRSAPLNCLGLLSLASLPFTKFLWLPLRRRRAMRAFEASRGGARSSVA